MTFLSLDCLALPHNPLSVNHEGTCTGLMAHSVTKGCTLHSLLAWCVVAGAKRVLALSKWRRGASKQQIYHLEDIQRPPVNLEMANTPSSKWANNFGGHVCALGRVYSNCKSSGSLACINAYVLACPPNPIQNSWTTRRWWDVMCHLANTESEKTDTGCSLG